MNKTTVPSLTKLCSSRSSRALPWGEVLSIQTKPFHQQQATFSGLLPLLSLDADRMAYVTTEHSEERKPSASPEADTRHQWPWIRNTPCIQQNNKCRVVGTRSSRLAPILSPLPAHHVIVPLHDSSPERAPVCSFLVGSSANRTSSSRIPHRLQRCFQV